jgi:hypothetical protein
MNLPVIKTFPEAVEIWKISIMLSPGSITMPSDIVCYIKLSQASFVIHVANFSKNRTFSPGPVMHATDTPGDSCITVGVTTVQLIAVVKHDSC